MANVKVELTGDEQRLLASLDKIVQKERELARAGQEVSEKSGRGQDGMLKQFQGVNREFGQILSLGSRFLGVLGISGGVLGAIQAIRAESEKIKVNLLSLGTVQVGAGQAAAAVAGAGGPGADLTISKVAQEMGLPEERVRAAYGKLAAGGELRGKGMESQLRRTMEEEMGGPGWQERQWEAAGRNPAMMAGLVSSELERSGKRALVSPITMVGAQNQQKALQAKLEQDLKDYAARVAGYESHEKMPSRPFRSDEAETVRLSAYMRARDQVRQIYGFKAEADELGLGEQKLFYGSEAKELTKDIYNAARNMREQAERAKQAADAEAVAKRKVR